MTGLADLDLVALARAGDPQAFAEILLRYRGKCMCIAVSILKDPSDAEDAVQIAFLKAFAHLDQFQGSSEFWTWLRRIAENAALMRLRSRRRLRFDYIEDIYVRDGDAMFVDQSPDPEHLAAEAQLRHRLHTEIRRLPTLLRSMLLVRNTACSIEAAAAQTGITVFAAKSRLQRANAELRNRMRKHLPRRHKTSSSER